MNQIKNNIPVILLLFIAPYFFNPEVSLPQAIIAAALAALCGYKYYLEQKQLPNYEKIFEERLLQMGNISDENFKKIEEQIISVKQKVGMEGYVNTQKKKLAEAQKVSGIW